MCNKLIMGSRSPLKDVAWVTNLQADIDIPVPQVAFFLLEVEIVEHVVEGGAAGGFVVKGK